MKTITTLLLAATVTFSVNANADAVHNDPGINDVFPVKETQIKPQQVDLIADTGQEVWSVEYEQWVNPADFNSIAKESVANALRELEKYPPAAGKRSGEVFIWDETADEFQLQ